MVVTVKHGIDLLERTTLNVLIAVAILKQYFRILHNLNWRGPQLARLNFHVGSVQAMGSANLEKVIRLGLAALGDDQDPVVAGTPPLLTLQLLLLALFWGIVARHQCFSPKV